MDEIVLKKCQLLVQFGQMKKKIVFIVIGLLLIPAIGIFGYNFFSRKYEIKPKERVLGEQELEVTPTPTSTPQPTYKSIPTNTSVPLPSINTQQSNNEQESEITSNQKAVLNGINKAIEETKTKIAEQKEILDRETKDYCPALNLQWSDYQACETERFAKHKRAEEEYLRLQELNKELALEALRILGQR